MNKMIKYKVIKPIFGLEVGDILVYNEEDNTYDFDYFNEDITENYSMLSNKSISLTVDTLILNSANFEEVQDKNYADVSTEYDYIKPYAIRAYRVVKAGVVEFEGSDYNLNIGDTVIKGIDGSYIPVTKKVFDKLFKVII